VDFDELLSRSDVLSLHCPLNDKTKYLINSDALNKMKKTAIIINVARGKVVNNADLAEALKNGTIAAAGLDVIEQEPIAKDNPLMEIQDSSRLLITPHMAWASTEARNRCVSECAGNIRSYMKGESRNRIV
jgi:glycerate dehydrogenase